MSHATDPKDDIPAEELRRLFVYDRSTGLVTRRVRRGRKLAGSPVGSPHCGDYLSTYINGRNYLLHRLIWIMQTGSPPAGDVEHKNGAGSNNRWSNLRDATRSQNLANAKRRSDNTSGFKGVGTRGRRFVARIRIAGRTRWLGSFPTAELAHAKYMQRAREAYGEFARAE